MSRGPHAGHRERARRGVGEADAEGVGAVGDVVGRIRMAFGRAEHDGRAVRQIARALDATSPRPRPRSRSRGSSRSRRNGSETQRAAR